MIEAVLGFPVSLLFVAAIAFIYKPGFPRKAWLFSAFGLLLISFLAPEKLRLVLLLPGGAGIIIFVSAWMVVFFSSTKYSPAITFNANPLPKTIAGDYIKS